MKTRIEQILFLQSFYLSVICIIVFCGTSAPLLFHWLWNRNVGTGAPFYNAVLCPLFTSVFFVLVYAHYSQFKISNELRHLLSDPTARAKQLKNKTSARIASDLAARSFLFLYCIFFFFIHVLLGVQLIGLNYLDSVYGAICILLISSIIISSQKIPKERRFETIMASLSSLPSRHTTFGVSKLQFGALARPAPMVRGWLAASASHHPMRLRLLSDYGETYTEAPDLTHHRPEPKRSAPTSGESVDLPATGYRLAASVERGAIRKKGEPTGKRQKRQPSETRSCLTARSSFASRSTLRGRPFAIESGVNTLASYGPHTLWAHKSQHQAALQQKLKLEDAKSSYRTHLKRDSGETWSASIATEDVFRRSTERKRASHLHDRRDVGCGSMNVAHTGIVLFILGILLSNTFKFEFTEQLLSGPLGAKHLGSQVCCLRSIDHSFAPTYHSICANLLIYQKVNFDASHLCTAPFAYKLKQYLQHTNSQQAALHDQLESPPFEVRAIPNGLSLTAPIGYEGELQGFVRIGPSLQGSEGSDRTERIAKRPDSGPVGPSIEYSAENSKEAPLEVLTAVCMFPEKRFYYSTQGAVATKVAIHSNLFTDFYSLIGTGSFETGWFTTIMKLPFIFCIWLGFLFGVLGGLLSLKKQLQKSKLYWL